MTTIRAISQRHNRYDWSMTVDPFDPETVICFRCALYRNKDHSFPRSMATIHIERHENLVLHESLKPEGDEL